MKGNKIFDGVLVYLDGTKKQISVPAQRDADSYLIPDALMIGDRYFLLALDQKEPDTFLYHEMELLIH